MKQQPLAILLLSCHALASAQGSTEPTSAKKLEPGTRLNLHLDAVDAPPSPEDINTCVVASAEPERVVFTNVCHSNNVEIDFCGWRSTQTPPAFADNRQQHGALVAFHLGQTGNVVTRYFRSDVFHPNTTYVYKYRTCFYRGKGVAGAENCPSDCPADPSPPPEKEVQPNVEPASGAGASLFSDAIGKNNEQLAAAGQSAAQTVARIHEQEAASNASSGPGFFDVLLTFAGGAYLNKLGFANQAQALVTQTISGQPVDAGALLQGALVSKVSGTSPATAGTNPHCQAILNACVAEIQSAAQSNGSCNMTSRASAVTASCRQRISVACEGEQGLDKVLSFLDQESAGNARYASQVCTNN